MNPQYVPQQLYGVSQNYSTDRASPQSLQNVSLNASIEKSVSGPTPPAPDGGSGMPPQFALKNGAPQFQNGPGFGPPPGQLPSSQNFPPPGQRDSPIPNLPPSQFNQGPPPLGKPQQFGQGSQPPTGFNQPPSKSIPSQQLPPQQLPPQNRFPGAQPPNLHQLLPNTKSLPPGPTNANQLSSRAGFMSQGTQPNTQSDLDQGNLAKQPLPLSQPPSGSSPGQFPPTSQPPSDPPSSQPLVNSNQLPPSSQPPSSLHPLPPPSSQTSNQLTSSLSGGNLSGSPVHQQPNDQSPKGQYQAPSNIDGANQGAPGTNPLIQQPSGPHPPQGPSPMSQPPSGLHPPQGPNQTPPNINQPFSGPHSTQGLQQIPPSSMTQPLSAPQGGFNQFSPSGNQLPTQQTQPGPNQFKPSGQPSFNQHPQLNQPPLGPSQSKPSSYPPPPGSFPPPTNSQQFTNVPPPNQFNQPPPSQFNQPPLPGQFSQPPGRIPPTSQQPTRQGIPPLPPGPHQLTNQMQNMNLANQRPYGGGVNGENLPYMPPPLTQQQQYMNGQQQQLRGPPGPGYPPMPGQPQPMAAGGHYPQGAYQQQAHQNKTRLDPDQMPSPIQVTMDDQRQKAGLFVTNQRGLVPPLVTTDFVVQDQGNCSPRFMRSTMYCVPISNDIMKQTALPFTLAISPMARLVEGESAPPIVNFGELGPVRCNRCKAYMCPYMQFIDSGRRFQCLFCKATTDVPAEYFQHLDHTGQRMDRFERPELILGAYEFVATADYCRNKTLPKPPAVIFVIDVSYNNVKSGLVHLLCSQMKDIIQNLPVDQGQEKSNMRVGFITYNSSVHFYNIKGTLAAPQMLIVGDTQEMFMPLLDGFLCTPEESSGVIDALMQQIPLMFGDTRETETILYPAILAGLEALKASDCTGKLMVFHSTLPSAEAPGKLKNRDDRKLLGTEKERTVLQPQNQVYNQLGQDCVAAGCSVDLFIFNNAYIDIATIGQVSRLTGGEVFKYTYFQADIDGDRLIKDIIMDISRPIAFDAVMRVRTSTGVRPTEFYGHFFMSNTTDMELAAIDCDKAVSVEIKHDDKLSEDEGVYIQTALLYTSCSGQRRLRILNLSLKTCSQMADLYKSCDSDTFINYVAKQAVYKLLDNNPKAVKDNLINRTAQILATYRKNCTTQSSAGQLILPECMKLVPLYINCLLKSDAISGGPDMTIDDRSFVMQAVMIMDVQTSVHHFYPRLIPLHEINPTQDPIEVPMPIRCTYEKLNQQGVYLLENGIHMFMWIGLGANPEFTQKVFDVPSAIQIDVEKFTLPELNNPMSIAVRNLIEDIRVQRHRCMRLTIVRQREKLEAVFKHFLVEDAGNDGTPSYVDFLIHMHKEIRGLLS